MTDVIPTESKKRIYTQQHIDCMTAILCFKRTGLPIAGIQEFFRLEDDIPGNIDQMVAILKEHEQNTREKIERMESDLEHIQQKVRYYSAVRDAIKNGDEMPSWDSCGCGESAVDISPGFSAETHTSFKRAGKKRLASLFLPALLIFSITFSLHTRNFFCISRIKSFPRKKNSPIRYSTLRPTQITDGQVMQDGSVPTTKSSERFLLLRTASDKKDIH